MAANNVDGTPGGRRKVVIDTDAGLDDAQAILMTLAHCHDVDVVAITTVHGNVGVHQVTRNVLRLLKAAKRLDVSDAQCALSYIRPLVSFQRPWFQQNSKFFFRHQTASCHEF